ncbi:MAG: hypothetical protein KAR21_16820 [Spirochaetales bacterium]|nr:hypothetical protein [Spirochaetales bacterium]
MEVEKAIFHYYKSEIDKVETPLSVIPGKPYKAARDRIYNIVFAAAIILVCIPVFSNINMPSPLSVRAAEFSEYHNLDTVIPAGLLEINKFVSQSLITGGNR